jgi:hypothetical protein
MTVTANETKKYFEEKLQIPSCADITRWENGAQGRI